MTGQAEPAENPSPEFVWGSRCQDCGAPYRTDVDAWYRAYAHRLRAQVRSWGRCGTHIDADDIVQDCFASLAVQFSEVKNPSAWLRTVAKRTMARAWQESAQVTAGDASEMLQDERVRARWTSLARQPDLDTNLRVRTALRTMTELPDRQRISWYLARVEGWTHAEIGDYLEIATATVAVHIHRADNTIRTAVPPLASRSQTYQLSDYLLNDYPLNDYQHELPTDTTLVVWVWCPCWPGKPNRPQEPEQWQAAQRELPKVNSRPLLGSGMSPKTADVDTKARQDDADIVVARLPWRLGTTERQRKRSRIKVVALADYVAVLLAEGWEIAEVCAVLTGASMAQAPDAAAAAQMNQWRAALKGARVTARK